jgi:glucose-1-phosphate cytidylyltransferase
LKVVLFCGGQGLRMQGAANDLPKPMVPLGNRPLVWHLMKYYAHWGHTDFILCLGHKGSAIKEFFAGYQEWISNDFVISGGRTMELLRQDLQNWRITLVDTGLNATIAERLMAVRPFLGDDEVFLANYADGLSDCPVPAVLQRLEETQAAAAFMVTRPNMTLHFVHFHPDGQVQDIVDAQQDGTWVNAGFFALRREVFDYIHPGDELVIEPFARLIAKGKLASLAYEGFWRCCDTFKDLQVLEGLLARGPAPWELWRMPEAAGDRPSVPEAACAQPALTD